MARAAADHLGAVGVAVEPARDSRYHRRDRHEFAGLPGCRADRVHGSVYSQFVGMVLPAGRGGEVHRIDRRGEEVAQSGIGGDYLDQCGVSGVQFDAVGVKRKA